MVWSQLPPSRERTSERGDRRGHDRRPAPWMRHAAPHGPRNTLCDCCVTVLLLSDHNNREEKEGQAASDPAIASHTRHSHTDVSRHTHARPLSLLSHTRPITGVPQECAVVDQLALREVEMCYYCIGIFSSRECGSAAFPAHNSQVLQSHSAHRRGRHPTGTRCGQETGSLQTVRSPSKPFESSSRSHSSITTPLARSPPPRARLAPPPALPCPGHRHATTSSGRS